MPANDGAPDVWYGLIRPQDGQVSFSLKRLTYDNASSVESLRRSAHADRYADTLETGIWLSCDILSPSERTATGKRLPERTLTMPQRSPLASMSFESSIG